MSNVLELERDEDTLALTYAPDKKGGGLLLVEAYERWAGDSLIGFGANANITLTQDHAKQILAFLKEHLE